MNGDSTTCYRDIAIQFSYHHLTALNNTKLSLPDTNQLPWHLMNEGSTTCCQGNSNLFALQQLLDLDSTKLSYHWSNHALAPQPSNCRYEHQSHYPSVNNTNVLRHKPNQFLRCDNYVDLQNNRLVSLLDYHIVPHDVCWYL